MHFLKHLRYGQVTDRDEELLDDLLLEEKELELGNTNWRDVALVTPRHAVRNEWNGEAIRKHCRESGRRLFICPAEDTIHGKPLNLAERYALASRKPPKGKRRRKDLPDNVEMAIGAKVLVTENIETDLDIANGTRGEIVDIVLDEREPPIDPHSEIVHLQYPPAFVLVQLERTRAEKLEYLDPGVIPIRPILQTMRINVRGPNGRTKIRTVKRSQYPMTLAYAFTDYRSQGQTIRFVIVDIARPPTGSLSLFHMYVALSRSSGRGTIRLLRKPDKEVLRGGHSPELLAEDDRLKEMDETTRQWWQKMSSAMEN